MKKLSFLSLVLIFAVACSRKAEESRSVIFSGKITNPKDTVLILYSESFRDTIPVSDDGSFRKALDTVTEGYYSFTHGKEYTDLFLSPGDSLFVTFNTDEFDETMHYEGKGAEKSNYLATAMLQSEERYSIEEEMFASSEEVFLKIADSLRTADEKRLQAFHDSFPEVAEKFKHFEKGKITYAHAQNLLQYPGMHGYVTGEKDFEPSASYYNFLSLLKKEDETLLDVTEYRQFLQAYLRHKTSDIYKQDTTLRKKKSGHFDILYAAVKKEFAQPAVLDYMKYTVLSEWMDMRGIEEVEDAVKDFVKSSPDKKRVEAINELYGKWKNLVRGNPAPGFRYVSIAGDTVALADLRGKSVYIDVWATWCGPCRAEIPHLEKLQEEFSGKNIAFVSVSIDDNKEAWEKMVKEKNMKGIQLFATGAWKSEIVKSYAISGIPRFILINSKGEIVTANAPRPSDESLKELLSSEAVM